MSFVSRNRRELDRNGVGGKNNEMIDFQIYRTIIMGGWSIRRKRAMKKKNSDCYTLFSMRKETLCLGREKGVKRRHVSEKWKVAIR